MGLLEPCQPLFSLYKTVPLSLSYGGITRASLCLQTPNCISLLIPNKPIFTGKKKKKEMGACLCKMNLGGGNTTDTLWFPYVRKH